MKKFPHAVLVCATLCLSAVADELRDDGRIVSWREASHALWGGELQDVQVFLDSPATHPPRWNYRLTRISTGWVNQMEVFYFREEDAVTECQRVVVDISPDHDWVVIEEENCVLNGDEQTCKWGEIEKLHQTLKPRYFYSMNLGLWIWERRLGPDQKETESLFIPVTDPNPEAWKFWQAGNTSHLLQATRRELAHQNEKSEQDE